MSQLFKYSNYLEKSRTIRFVRGFSLMEILIGSALFLIVGIAAYGAFASLFQLALASQARTLAIELADEQFEIIRNMPYTSIGLTNGIPLGILPQDQTIVRGGMTFNVDLTIRNINLATSSLQASDKLVVVSVDCPACKNFQPVEFTGQVSPANLQSASNGGALVIQVLNAAGQAVQDADVSVQSTATSSVQDHDVTNNSGYLNIIGVPPGNNVYNIIVTKDGYSTDRTYAPGGSGNPNPTKPNVTVINQAVSQATFAIDQLSSLHFSSVTSMCTPVANFHFNLTGAKLIGTNVRKYNQNLITNGSGQLDLNNNMEWDTYTVTPTDASYDLAGINPFSPFVLNPNNSQNVQFVLVPHSANSLLVTVVDSATGLPVSGADVELVGNSYDQDFITGRGYISQTDWSGGSGQSSYSNQTRYFSDNGNVDTATSSGNVVMAQAFGKYNTNATGTLESSTFDTGSNSNFYTFSWTPLTQSPLAGSTSVKFQFAVSTSSDPGTWDYVGPSGTSADYFMVPGSSINALQNGNRYARYMMYLTTNTATVTPMVSNVSFAYTSACIPPGQVMFSSLNSGSYTLTVSKYGYTAYSSPITISGSKQQVVQLVSNP